MSAIDGFARVRAGARWTVDDLARTVEAVLAGEPARLWSADDVRTRLAFGGEGGPAATSVRQALARLEDSGRIEREDVWGRRGWGNARHGYRTRRGTAAGRLAAAA